MQRRRNAIRHLKVLIVLALTIGLGGSLACSGDASPPPKVDVELFGWSDQAGQSRFVRELIDYPNAQAVAIKLTQPNDQNLLASESAPIVEGSLQIPEMSFGENLRLDFDLIDGEGNRIATGATPLFDSSPGSTDLDVRVMLAPVHDFAPVGARYTVDAVEGTWEYQTTKFDDRSTPDNYLGRVGHEAVPTSRGNVLIVGGGQVPPGRAVDAYPDLTGVLNDLQLFQQKSGYISDLSFDESNNSIRPGGADRLAVGRAYHTVTPLGEDRYLVVGGFTRNAGKTEPTGSIELIDLRAEPGERVNRLIGADGSPLTLSTPRGLHTATFRNTAEDRHVVITGGLGANGENDVTRSIEIIDLENRVVESGGQLQRARAEHSALLMGDGTGAIWILGGRNNVDGALPSTEMLHPRGSMVTTESKPPMKVARFDMGVERISGKVVVVCGGYTSVEGQGSPTNNCQIGNMDRDRWLGSWSMGKERGGLSLVEMSQSEDLVVIGGQDSNAETVETASIFKFQGRGSDPPFELLEDRGTMYKTRFHSTVTPLPNGMMLLTGGMGSVDGSTAPLPSLEYYNPADVVRAR